MYFPRAPLTNYRCRPAAGLRVCWPADLPHGLEFVQARTRADPGFSGRPMRSRSTPEGRGSPISRPVVLGRYLVRACPRSGGRQGALERRQRSRYRCPGRPPATGLTSARALSGPRFRSGSLIRPASVPDTPAVRPASGAARCSGSRFVARSSVGGPLWSPIAAPGCTQLGAHKLRQTLVELLQLGLGRLCHLVQLGGLPSLEPLAQAYFLHPCFSIKLSKPDCPVPSAYRRCSRQPSALFPRSAFPVRYCRTPAASSTIPEPWRPAGVRQARP